LLLELSFTDLLHGTVVGDSGVILRTNDGGMNWFQLISGTNALLCHVSFIDANIGWAVGYIYNNPSNYYGIILHTANAGETWEQQFIIDNQGLFGVSFVDANNGWVVGLSGLILKTTNGGESWLQQNSGSMFPLSDVSFVDENIGWAVGGWHDVVGTVLKTIDGGVTWTELFISAEPNISVCFTDENIGIVICADPYFDKILRTTDGGINWGFQSSGEARFLSDVFCIDALNAWVVGWGGTILHTTNGGITSIGGEFDRIPSEYFLSQNFPNPFNSTTTIGLRIENKSKVKITILNVISEEVAVVLDEEREPGYHQIEFNANNLSSGVYFYSLQAGSFIETKKMLLLK
jgi:photosystem II stability/assembly factor-like uncharacterized protein